MKRFIKLISLVAILVILIVSYILYSNYIKENDTSEEESIVDNSVTVLNIDETTITEIEFEYSDEKISLINSDGEWKVSGDEDFPIDDSYTTHIIDELSYILADRLVADNLDNESDFGFDSPNFTVKYKTSDSNEYVYTIGAHNSVSKGYYFKHSTQDKIYIGGENIVDAFSNNLLDMIEFDELPFSDANDIFYVDYTYNGNQILLTTDSSEAEYYTDIYTLFLKKNGGMLLPADDVKVNKVYEAVADIQLEKCVEYKPTSETLEKYGLGDNKILTLKYGYYEEVSDETTGTSVKNEKTYSINIGRYTNEDSEVSYYATVDSSYALYQIDETLGKALFDSIDVEFESDLVSPMLSEKVESFKCEIGDVVYVYTIDDMKNSDKISNVFNKITSIVKVGTADKEKGKLIFKTVFMCGDIDLTLNVYEYDSENYVATFDEWDDMLVPIEKIDGIIDALESN